MAPDKVMAQDQVVRSTPIPSEHDADVNRSGSQAVCLLSVRVDGGQSFDGQEKLCPRKLAQKCNEVLE